MKTVLPVVAVALSLVACTSSGGSTGVSPGSGMSEDKAKSALLSESEVGSGLKATKSDAAANPFPCTPSAPPLDKQVPPRVKVESTFTDSTKDLQFSEEIDNYGDAATVAKALGIGEKGLACPEGTVGPLTVTITGPIDLAKSIKAKVDKVEAWAITSPGAKESIIVSKIGPHLVVLTFGATAGANDSSEDAAGITQRALAKVSSAAG